MKRLGLGAYVSCSCGNHYVDLEAMAGNGLGFYHCNKCNVPLVIRDDQGRFYYVGQEIKEGRRKDATT